MLLNSVSFLLGAGRSLWFRVVGRLPASEVLQVVVLPLLAISRPASYRSRYVHITLLLGTGWFLSQVLSDAVNESDARDFLRGWANILMIVSGFAVWVAIVPGFPELRYRLYLIGLAAGGAVGLVTGLVPVGATPEEFWNLQVAPITGPVSVVAIWVLYRRYPKAALCFGCIYGVGAVAMGARAHGAAFVFASLATVIARQVESQELRVRASSVVKYGLAAVALAGIVFWGFVSVGLSGALGPKTQAQLAVLKNPYNPVNVVLFVRPSAYAAGRAILDAPILGHGSWATDPRYAVYMDRIVREVADPFSAVGGGRLDFGTVLLGGTGEIPAHSHLLGAWVRGGILGAAFWGYQLGVFLVIGLRFVARGREVVAPIVFWGVFTGWWNILFNPMGWGRKEWPALAAFLIVYELIGNRRRDEEESGAGEIS